eukprot:1160556-Alexandrium_andersonii.AAC.1
MQGWVHARPVLHLPPVAARSCKHSLKRIRPCHIHLLASLGNLDELACNLLEPFQVSLPAIAQERTNPTIASLIFESAPTAPQQTASRTACRGQCTMRGGPRISSAHTHTHKYTLYLSLSLSLPPPTLTRCSTALNKNGRI